MSDGGGATASTNIRALIVDDEVNLRFAVERRLRKTGIATGSASSVRHAIDRLRAEPYDVVLCDLRMPGGGGDQLLRWLASYSPSTKVIVVSGFITDEFKRTFPEGEYLRHLDKPVDLDGLVALIEELGPRRGFYGTSIEVEFFDYVQMIALTGRDKLIEVETPRGNGLIWFEHGDIVHVEYGDLRGEKAFYQVLAVNRGTFQEVFWSDPPKRTVQRSSTHLLMEAARMADEGALQLLEAHAPEVVRTPLPGGAAVPGAIDDEISFESLGAAPIEDADDIFEEPTLASPTHKPVPRAPKARPIPSAPPLRGAPTAGGGPTPSPDLRVEETLVPRAVLDVATPVAELDPSESVLEGGPTAGHAIFEDPDTRQVMLEQFWQFEGINGVAIISSTGKVLAEDMRANGSMVTLAGFYMRGAARLARTLGYNVFDGVVARSVNGQQMVMVSMGAASAVLSVDGGHDPEAVREAVMGVE